MMPARLVILLGPPACGKGTQARFLNRRFGWRVFSTGVAIRSHVRRGTAFGKRFESLLGSAYLLPDAVTMELVEAELVGHAGGLVLDGFPRTVPQAAMFDAYCARRGWTIDSVVFFDGSEAGLGDRILHRLTCTHCGGTFRIGLEGETIDYAGDPCPDCGESLSRRHDDLPEVFGERFEEYTRLTHPLADYYAARGLVLRVDALPSPDALATALEAHFLSMP